MNRRDPGQPKPGAPPGWAHECGAAALDPSAVGTRSSSELTEPIARYCWGYDERRRDLLESCFVADAVWEGVVAGSERVGPFRGRDRILEWLTEFWPHQRDQRRHVLANQIVESSSASEAEVYAYLLLYSARDQSASLETTGFYRVKLVALEGTWRIARLSAGFDAPFWPGKLERLSDSARHRHGLFGGADPGAVSDL